MTKAWIIILQWIIFPLFAAFALLYISIATTLGPWIAPLIVIMGHATLQATSKHYSSTFFKESKFNTLIGLQQPASFVGIIATVFGFVFPTLYFLDKQQFAKFFTFAGFFQLCTIQFLAISVGFWLGEKLLSHTQKAKVAPSPISNLITTSAHDILESNHKALNFGIASSFIITLAKTLTKTLWPLTNVITQPLLPATWAAGYMMGHKFLSAIACGALIKTLFLVIDNFCTHRLTITQSLWVDSSNLQAFATGIILFGLGKELLGFFNDEALPKTLHLNHLKINNSSSAITLLLSTLILWLILPQYSFHSLCASAITIVGAVLITLEICNLFLSTGLAPYGRFITLVMLAIIFCTKNTLPANTIVLHCLFIGCVAAGAIHILMQGPMQKTDTTKTGYLNFIFLSALIPLAFIGMTYVLELGSADLFALRGQARAMLITAPHFSPIYLAVGVGIALILTLLNLYSSVLFGIILMPFGLLIALATGSISKRYFNTKTASKFFSGMFVGEPIFIILWLCYKFVLMHHQ